MHGVAPTPHADSRRPAPGPCRGTTEWGSNLSRPRISHSPAGIGRARIRNCNRPSHPQPAPGPSPAPSQTLPGPRPGPLFTPGRVHETFAGIQGQETLIPKTTGWTGRQGRSWRARGRHPGGVRASFTGCAREERGDGTAPEPSAPSRLADPFTSAGARVGGGRIVSCHGPSPPPPAAGPSLAPSQTLPGPRPGPLFTPGRVPETFAGIQGRETLIPKTTVRTGQQGRSWRAR